MVINHQALLKYLITNVRVEILTTIVITKYTDYKNRHRRKYYRTKKNNTIKNNTRS